MEGDRARSGEGTHCPLPRSPAGREISDSQKSGEVSALALRPRLTLPSCLSLQTSALGVIFLPLPSPAWRRSILRGNTPQGPDPACRRLG